MTRVRPKEVMFVSFSGGRTSAYMCHWLIKNKSEKYDFIFVFANTGQEHEKTLDFVHKCDLHFGLNLVWVEAVVHNTRKRCTHKIVDYDNASRSGLPFEDVIKKYGIPNTGFPHCTRELKMNPIFSYKRSLGFKSNHQMAIGIRSDEIDRASSDAKRNGLVYPLISMTSKTLPEIRHWWKRQKFDLEIPEHLGNCLTCWKKSDRKLLTLAKHDPEIFSFFHRMESRYSNNGVGDMERVFFRGGRSTSDILQESKGDFLEFTDHMPPLQLGMFDPMDLEEDCGSGCEII